VRQAELYTCANILQSKAAEAAGPGNSKLNCLMPTIRRKERDSQRLVQPVGQQRPRLFLVVPCCGRVESRRNEMLLLRGQIIASRSVRSSSMNGKCDSTENRQPLARASCLYLI
jgi:hypothetical protein